MPGSFGIFKKEIRGWICSNFNKNAKILDVGAGCGTYYNLLCDKFENIDCVEVFKPYIDKFGLSGKYKNVFNCNIFGFEYDFYNLIIFGDVIEHLTVDDAKKVLEYARKRCDNMIVAVPYMYEQGVCEDNVYEIHKQPDLTKKNVVERYPFLSILYGNDRYGYYIKRNEQTEIS